MTTYVFPPEPQPSCAVRGTDARYAVNRIFCVGRNYAEHAKEMGNDTREPPFYFGKPTAALTPSGATVPYACATQDLHHEVELVIALGLPVFRVTPEVARAAIWGYGVGLDMTRRDLQGQAKKLGRPWDTGKGFDHSAILGELVRVADVGYLERGAITLDVNGVQRQQGDLSDMIWNPAEIVANLSQLYHLKAGDLIYTGTPAGVGAVVAGDVLHGRVEGVGEVMLTLGPAE
ncbi:fumarylacetoacetate hydrolase family protein [Roseateles paludis]|jgi:fumarylpyruvate hydrolase|uniref:Fumarylacetoacetate hydrolase family protein n=1 Tax=Roseateles paludis TaxID=3145238 RepID=A0ABV0FZ02_9BURK